MDTLLSPLYYLVSWIMIGWHWVFAELLGIPNDGVNWALSIIGLVVVIRIMLIPLFVRQIKAQRNMQMLQPKVREIQKKYKGDRERLQQETMKLYKDTGTNPFASCMPIILQAPFLFALFRVLDGIARDIPRGAFVTHPAAVRVGPGKPRSSGRRCRRPSWTRRTSRPRSSRSSWWS